MSGDVTSIDGTTRLLMDEMGRVTDAAVACPARRPGGTAGPFDGFRHRRAAGLEDDRVEAIVGISALQSGDHGEAPENLLILNGAWEAMLREAAVRVMAPLGAAEGETAGTPGEGSPGAPSRCPSPNMSACFTPPRDCGGGRVAERHVRPPGPGARGADRRADPADAFRGRSACAAPGAPSAARPGAAMVARPGPVPGAGDGARTGHAPRPQPVGNAVSAGAGGRLPGAASRALRGAWCWRCGLSWRLSERARMGLGTCAGGFTGFWPSAGCSTVTWPVSCRIPGGCRWCWPSCRGAILAMLADAVLLEAARAPLWRRSVARVAFLVSLGHRRGARFRTAVLPHPHPAGDRAVLRNLRA
jgi:hypothetical protein